MQGEGLSTRSWGGGGEVWVVGRGLRPTRARLLRDALRSSSWSVSSSEATLS